MEVLENSAFEQLALRNMLASSPRPTSPPCLMPRRSASVYLTCLGDPTIGIWTPAPECLNGYVVFQNMMHLAVPASPLTLSQTATDHIVPSFLIRGFHIWHFSFLLSPASQNLAQLHSDLLNKWSLNVWQRNEDRSYGVRVWPLLK